MYRRAGAGLLLRCGSALCEATRQRGFAHGRRRDADHHTRRPHHRTEPNEGFASSSAERHTVKDAPRLADSGQVLDALLALSSALYEDEAAASAVRVAEDANVAAPAAPQPDDAYADVDAASLMDLMDDAAVQSEPSGAAATQLVPAAVQAALPPSGTVSASHLSATFATADVPLEEKVLRLMDLCSAPALSPSARAATPPAAAALVLPGLDMKAVLTHGAITHRHLRRLCLARCDFSLVRWSCVTVEDCDFSRCLFYRGALDGVTFRRCRFTGSILKGVHCGGADSATASATAAVRFEDCDFRLAAVGLICGDAGAARRRHGPPVRFVRCNFDLSDFQFSEGLGDSSMFLRCSNTDLASRFPLRARGGVS